MWWSQVRGGGKRIIAIGERSYIIEKMIFPVGNLNEIPSNTYIIAEWDLATGKLLFHRAGEFRHHSLSHDGDWYSDRNGKRFDTLTGRERPAFVLPPNQTIGGHVFDYCPDFQESRDGR